MQADETTRRTSPLVIVAAWLIVGIPAAWGVSQTVIKSLALFTTTSPATAPATQPASR